MTLNCILRFTLYCTVNTLHLGYKHQSADLSKKVKCTLVQAVWSIGGIEV